MYWRSSVLWGVKQRRSVVSYRHSGTRLLKSLKGKYRPSQNVGNQLSTSATHRPKRAKASSWYKYGRQVAINSTFRNCVRWHFFTKLANMVDVIMLRSVSRLIWSRQKCEHEASYMKVYLSNRFKLKCKILHQKRSFINILTVFLSLIPVKYYEHISVTEFWSYV